MNNILDLRGKFYARQTGLKDDFINVNNGKVIGAIDIKKPLRYPNGAIISTTIEIDVYYHVIKERYTDRFIVIKQNREMTFKETAGRNVFLTKEEAEKECDVLNTQDKLLRKIAEIDRDCEETDKDYYLYYDHYSKEVNWRSNFFETQGAFCFSEKAKDWLLSDEVTEQERKLFCNIKD
jgi:hypothetical protein